MDKKSLCENIIRAVIEHVRPEESVKRALCKLDLSKHQSGRLILVSVGKAAWTMADAAYKQLGDAVTDGIVITKHGHSMGAIGKLTVGEAGHPVPDDASFYYTEKALELTDSLTKDDTVLFLLSGGGSALFELPYINKNELSSLTEQLLACGAEITEVNTVRKHLSRVKGGRFALHCAPAKIHSIVLSDIIGDPLDMIASGPAYPDSTSKADVLKITSKYGIKLSSEALAALDDETPKALENVKTHITGSVRELCSAAAEECKKLGYTPLILTDRMCCEAREAGSFIASAAVSHLSENAKIAIIAGGETVVHISGNGLGGRNQELALSASRFIGNKNIYLFSVGSDGTDGPTDAAGGYVDGSTAARLKEKNIDVFRALTDNDSYNALAAVNGLIFTGPTGTNVNDVTVALLN